MRHIVSVTDDYISVEETQTNNIEFEIFNERINDSCFIVLNQKQLHSFIGTLLHVQQKLKNK